MYPTGMDHTGPNPQGVTMHWFPAITRKTLQFALMAIPAHISSSSDAFEAMPEFSPKLSDCKDDGITPELWLSGVKMPVNCYYCGSDLKNVSAGFQHCVALPRPYVGINSTSQSNSQDGFNSVQPGTSSDS